MANYTTTDDTDQAKGDQAIINAAMRHFRLASDAEANNRQEALQDQRFRAGDQWDANTVNNRILESRPCLTINKIDAYCRQVENGQKQQRPRMKCHAVNSLASTPTADVLTGILRHVEVNSNADEAYDNAFRGATTWGWGYWRVVTDYCRDDSFDQDIFIQPIENAFSVYFDPNSQRLDGSDADYCIVTEMIPRDLFRSYYPGADDCSRLLDVGAGDMVDWVNKDNVRVAEYFRVVRTRETLVMLSNKLTLWEDEYKAGEAKLRKAGITKVAERASFRKRVEWYKLTGVEILEHRVLACRHIPVVPVYGNRMIVDGKRKVFGLVRFARDPQKMYNFWRTAMTELIAQAPKAKWLMAAGQDEGFENEYAQANQKANAILHYNTRDLEGNPVEPPQRLMPEAPPEGVMAAAESVSQDLQAVLGIVDPAMRISGNVSGKALQGEKIQSDQANYHYYDNLTMSLAHTARIVLDLVPHVYDTERVVRIIGEDDRPQLVTVNEVKEAQGIQKVLHDVTVGEYDVVMDAGPGYNTRRQEALATFTEMLGTPLGEEVGKVGGDLIVRMIDAPGADALADRMAAANPLAQVDQQSDIPQQAQMLIKRLQMQLQQCEQQLQAAGMEIKFKHGLEQMRQQGETQREHMRLAVKAHDVESRERTAMIDTHVEAQTALHDMRTKAITAQNVEELRGVVQLLLKHLDTATLERQAEREERETSAQQSEAH